MALATWAFVVLVLLIVVALMVLKITQGSTTLAPPPVTQAPAGVVQATTSLPAAVFDSAGAPVDGSPTPSVLDGQPPLISGGRPEVLYVGGEFCPYCAAERWALVAALGRFGTFTKLGATSSSKFEVFPGTATFSFEGAGYHSRYVSFSSIEEYGATPSASAPAGFPDLERLPAADQALVKRYGSSLSGGETQLPFVDVDNRLVVSGAAIGFSPALLQGLSMGQIASDLSDPTNPVSSGVLAEANLLTAAICEATGGRPQTVCASAGVQAAAARLKGGTTSG